MSTYLESISPSDRERAKRSIWRRFAWLDTRSEHDWNCIVQQQCHQVLHHWLDVTVSIDSIFRRKPDDRIARKLSSHGSIRFRTARILRTSPHFLDYLYHCSRFERAHFVSPGLVESYEEGCSSSCSFLWLPAFDWKIDLTLKNSKKNLTLLTQPELLSFKLSPKI